MHSNVLAKEGLVSGNERIQKKKKGWRILEEKIKGREEGGEERVKKRVIVVA